jgi:CHAT domain-containing protein/tetratricopeptide (TPR) repeat protein
MERQISAMLRGREYAKAMVVVKEFEQAVQLRFGVDSICYARAMANRASLFQVLNQVMDAAPLFEQSLAIYRRHLSPDHPELTLVMSNLGVNLFWQRQYAYAARLHEEALALRQRTSPIDEQAIAASLHNLADAYRYLGRAPQDVIKMYQRSLDIRRRVLRPDDPAIAQSLQNLASAREQIGDLGGAEADLRTALEIYRRSQQSDEIAVAAVLNRLGGIAFRRGQLKEAESKFRESLSVQRDSQTPQKLTMAATLDDFAVNQLEQQRLDEAKKLILEALSIRRSILPTSHATIARSLSNLSEVAWRQRKYAEALDLSRQATEIAAAVNRNDEVNRLWLQRHVRSAWSALPDADASTKRELANEALIATQRAVTNDLGQIISRMSARFAASNSQLREILRSGEGLAREQEVLETQLTGSFSLGQEEQLKAFTTIRAKLAAIEQRRADIRNQVQASFPDYFRLVSAEALSLDTIQSLLQANEALVVYFVSINDETFIWVITKGDTHWVKSELGTNALAERVAVLRCGLDATLWDETASANKCKGLVGISPHREMVTGGDKDESITVLPFNLTRAHELYNALLGPVGGTIKDKRLIVVPSGPLTSLPFNVLVAEPPNTSIPETLARYRNVAWLGKRTAITVLPSISSLKSLRQVAKASRASKPYLGIGNPLLHGAQDDPVWGADYKQRAELARTKRCAQTPNLQQIASARGARPVRGFPSMFRGAHADIEQIRYQAPLPETADELCEVARRLGVPDSDILLGADATEARLKELSEEGRLADYAILHFATHGVLSGQVEGLAEPGLILTPPPKGTSDLKALERDDGFLTASEIATLKLDADWVILSACNTAGPQGEGAEALSGIARAFFYAGARALLVSHWAVGSDAAVKLTTWAFAELKARPDIGRAEAMRISMRELIESGTPAEAHPSMWAPFAVVGEGALR